MATYTITSAEHKKNFPSQYGEKAVYTVAFEGETRTPVEITQKVDTKPPAPGDQVEGAIEKGTYGWILKKAFSPGRSSTNNFQRDPAERASIIRQHSQTVAIYWASVLQKAHPELKPNYEWLKGMIDWFDRDAKGEQQP